MSAADPMPAVEFEPRPCPSCGATTVYEAETLCRPSQDQTGEYDCAGEFDDAGRAVRATAASLAAIDAWCARNAPGDHRERISAP